MNNATKAGLERIMLELTEDAAYWESAPVVAQHGAVRASAVRAEILGEKYRAACLLGVA